MDISARMPEIHDAGVVSSIIEDSDTFRYSPPAHVKFLQSAVDNGARSQISRCAPYYGAEVTSRLGYRT
jgi:hypothetical protein